jgi:hypothetical protein
MTTQAKTVARPACPYCGEQQGYDEATPSKPVLGPKYMDGVHNGKIVWKRDTFFNTHCRACGQRIVWSVRLYPRPARPRWGRPWGERSSSSAPSGGQ